MSRGRSNTGRFRGLAFAFIPPQDHCVFATMCSSPRPFIPQDLRCAKRREDAYAMSHKIYAQYLRIGQHRCPKRSYLCFTTSILLDRHPQTNQINCFRPSRCGLRRNVMIPTAMPMVHEFSSYLACPTSHPGSRPLIRGAWKSHKVIIAGVVRRCEQTSAERHIAVLH